MHSPCAVFCARTCWVVLSLGVRAAGVRGVRLGFNVALNAMCLARDKTECNKHSGDIGVGYIGAWVVGLRSSDAATEFARAGGDGAWGAGRGCLGSRGGAG